MTADRYHVTDSRVAVEILMGAGVKSMREFPQFYPEASYPEFLERWGSHVGWTAQQLLDAEEVSNLLAPENDPHHHEVIGDCARLLGLTSPSDTS